jgi:hypothetical protein
MGPNHLRWHLLNEIDASGYDSLDTWTKIKGQVIDASKSYKSTIKDFIMEELETIPALECVPNNVLTHLLEPHKVNIVSFNKEFGQYFIKPKLEMVKVSGNPIPVRFRAFKNLEKWASESDTDKYREQYDLAIKLINVVTRKY